MWSPEWLLSGPSSPGSKSVVNHNRSLDVTIHCVTHLGNHGHQEVSRLDVATADFIFVLENLARMDQLHGRRRKLGVGALDHILDLGDSVGSIDVYGEFSALERLYSEIHAV